MATSSGKQTVITQFPMVSSVKNAQLMLVVLDWGLFSVLLTK